MSYSHLFISDPITRECEDKDGRFDSYRDSITYILANDEALAREYALFRAIAMRVNFKFDDYSLSIVDDKSVASALPKTEEEKLNFLKHLAVMILVNSDICRTEDVIIFDAIACKYGHSLCILDDVVEQITSRIVLNEQHNIDLKESLILSYQSAKDVDIEEFTRIYLEELDDYILGSDALF